MRIRNLAAAVALTAGLVATGTATAMAAEESAQVIAGPTPYANSAPLDGGDGTVLAADFTPNR